MHNCVDVVVVVVVVVVDVLLFVLIVFQRSTCILRFGSLFFGADCEARLRFPRPPSFPFSHDFFCENANCKRFAHSADARPESRVQSPEP